MLVADVARSRAFPSVIGGDRDKCVERLRALDRRQMRFCQFDAGGGAGLERVASLGERQGGEIVQFQIPV